MATAPLHACFIASDGFLRSNSVEYGPRGGGGYNQGDTEGGGPARYGPRKGMVPGGRALVPEEGGGKPYPFCGQNDTRL